MRNRSKTPCHCRLINIHFDDLSSREIVRWSQSRENEYFPKSIRTFDPCLGIWKWIMNLVCGYLSQDVDAKTTPIMYCFVPFSNCSDFYWLRPRTWQRMAICCVIWPVNGCFAHRSLIHINEGYILTVYLSWPSEGSRLDPLFVLNTWGRLSWKNLFRGF